jgi:hypothetical protein
MFLNWDSTGDILYSAQGLVRTAALMYHLARHLFGGPLER